MQQEHLLNDEAVQDFIVNGYLSLQTDVDPDMHQQIDAQLRFSVEHESWLGNNVAARIPALHQIVRCAPIAGALQSLLGPRYYCHPHRAIHRSTPVETDTAALAADIDAPAMGRGSSAGSAWHQDAQSPLARARHHLPRYLIGFYFPHDTPREMGPTRIQAGSYLHAQPHEPTGVVMPDLIKAGTFLLVHFDMLHAGFPNGSDRDRFMIKFVFARTTDFAPSWKHSNTRWLKSSDAIPDWSLNCANEYLWARMCGVTPPDSQQQPAADRPPCMQRIERIYDSLTLTDALQQLHDVAGQARHERILARGKDGKTRPRDDVRGYPIRWNERAVVMEEATYALVRIGEPAIPDLLDLLAHADPWLQINSAFALAEMGSDSAEALHPLLNSPHQQVVRQALDSLAIIGGSTDLPAIFASLGAHNPAWQQAEVERGWNGADQVRLNAAFAILNIVSRESPTDSHTTAITTERLSEALNDSNGYVAGVAAEALLRLGHPESIDIAVQYLSDRRWDDTLRAHFKSY